MTPREPTSVDAASAVRHLLGEEATNIQRFGTGSQHYVFDVVLASGRHIVARMAIAASRAVLAGGVYWNPRLRAIGVPVPALLAADIDGAFPTMLLERLSGRDLGDEYATMTEEQRLRLANDIVAIQRRVGTLPPARGYGYATSYDDAELLPSWLDVVRAHVRRSREHILLAGCVERTWADHVEGAVERAAPMLTAIPPTPFLDDTTTKNVLIAAGRLVGIVDTDYVCFGDPLYVLALTQVALLSSDMPTDYTEAWAGRLALSSTRKRLLIVYRAIFCLDFLSELGQRFNRESAAPLDPVYQQRLEGLLGRFLDALDASRATDRT